MSDRDEHGGQTQTEPDERRIRLSRRGFLTGSSAVLATTGLATIGSAVIHDAAAAPPRQATPEATPESAEAHPPPESPPPVAYFNTHEAATVEALTARILPGTADDPGAREAGVADYIDRGLVGKNYTYQLGGGGSNGLYPGERLNQYMGNSCVASLIHDFNADNFDHADLDFIGGASISVGGGERNPISSVGSVPTADGKTWGSSWKEALRTNWDSAIGIGTQGESLPYDDQYMDLDPTYRDRYGFPLLRITFDWHENDYNMIRYLAPKMREMLEQMGVQNIVTQDELTPYSIGPYQSTHNTGGAIMGSDPATSVTNKYGQVWDTPNLFVTGATLFPQNAGMNPTETVCALAYLAGDGLVNQYVKDPGKIIGSA